MSGDRESIYFLDGIPVPETPPPGEEPAPWGDTEVVGEARPRTDGYERATGTAVYPSDVVLPHMLHGAILRCPHPHARVKRIDTAAAEALPGVHAVITRHSPGCDLDWPSREGYPRKLLEETCRFEGEAVAAVAADDPWRARDALRAIEVEWEVLPAVTDHDKALDDGAPRVHPGGNQLGETRVQSRGDTESGFAGADAVVERTFRTAAQLHTPMELHGCVARWDGPRLTLWHSSQGVFATQSRVAQVMGLPLSRVRVVGHYMGGGFGSKLRPGKYAVIASLLARRTGRPVKLFLSREETLRAAGNRPPITMTLRAGARKDGTLTALDLSCTGTGGAWPAGGTGLVDWQIRDLYTCPAVRTESTDVFVHAGPSRPFRAPGHPQGSWALEQVLDELALELDLDPVDLRLANVPEVSQARDGQPPYSTTGLRQCLERGAEAFGWAEARQRVADQDPDAPVRRGVGVAACLWIAGDGGPPSTVVLKLFADGSVNLNMGASDIGTGTKTVMAMVVAEELGVRPDSVQVEHADTGTTQFATPSGGSKTIPTESPAVRDAAVALKRAVLDLAAEQLGVDASGLTLRDGVVVSDDGGDVSLPIPEIETLDRRGVLVGVGHRGPNPDGLAICPFGAQFAEVEVDTRTGEVRVLRFTAAHESGRVMNRLTWDSQVVGGITMGLGFGLTEARVIDPTTGRLVSGAWHDYKLPTALDAPGSVEPLPVELADDRANTTGAKGLGEPVTIPTAAAIANAIHSATGIRPTRTPVDPAWLVQALASREESP